MINKNQETISFNSDNKYRIDCFIKDTWNTTAEEIVKSPLQDRANCLINLLIKEDEIQFYQEQRNNSTLSGLVETGMVLIKPELANAQHLVINFF